jgi:Tfp pilus assembly protein PilX
MKGRARNQVLQRTRRRGGVLPVVVLMLAVVSIVALNVIDTGGRETELGAMRIETARAFYAAESGLIGAARLRQGGLTLPVQGATLSLPAGTAGSAQATFVSLPASGATSGSIRVVGQSGLGQRRLELQFQLQ